MTQALSLPFFLSFLSLYNKLGSVCPAVGERMAGRSNVAPIL